MNSGYIGFSSVYDTLMADYPYSAILHFIKDFVLPMGKKGLDLCAGTGTVTTVLSKEGATMTAFDLDRNMLSTARDKAAKEGQKIRFVEGDVNRIPQMQPFDFIISTCDGVNYVKNIKTFAKSLYSLLKVGGKIVLEFSSLFKAETILKDNLFYEDGEDVTWLFKNDYEKSSKSVLQDLTIFKKLKDGTYERTDDLAKQYFYALDEILNAFSDVGFKGVTLQNTNGFTANVEKAERLTLTAERR